MTVTGTVGGVCFATWAGADHLWIAGRRARLRRSDAIGRAPIGKENENIVVPGPKGSNLDSRAGPEGKPSA
jgi:hypothetical protein